MDKSVSASNPHLVYIPCSSTTQATIELNEQTTWAKKHCSSYLSSEIVNKNTIHREMDLIPVHSSDISFRSSQLNFGERMRIDSNGNVFWGAEFIIQHMFYDEQDVILFKLRWE